MSAESSGRANDSVPKVGTRPKRSSRAGPIVFFVFLFGVVALFTLLIVGSKMGGPPQSGDRFRDECERSYGSRGESAVLDCIINLRARFLLEYEQKKLDDTYRRAR